LRTVLGLTFRPKAEELVNAWRRLRNDEIHYLFPLENLKRRDHL
jgi:hypothetical protein